MAFCAFCGKQLSDQAPMCPQCGHPGPAAKSVATVRASGKAVEGFAIASLAFSISAFVVLPFIGSILGIVFGNIAGKNLAKNPALEGESMARAGVIIGWVGLALAVVITVIVILIAAVAGTNEVIFGPHRVRGI